VCKYIIPICPGKKADVDGNTILKGYSTPSLKDLRSDKIKNIELGRYF